MKLISRLSLSAVFGVLLAVGLFVPGKVSAAAAWQAHAGSGFGNGQITVMKFYPDTITVDEGDSITWTVAGDAHTISFLSGGAPPDPFSPAAQLPAGGSTYDGTG